MDKNKYISNKIKKLREEGKTQAQSIAIAYSMYETEGKKMQEGGSTYQEQYSKNMYPLWNKELSLPIIKVEPYNQDGVEGYRQYYTDPNSQEADYSFLSKEDYLRKKQQLKQNMQDYEPYLQMYLKKTGGREGVQVSYKEGGELPKYQPGGVYWDNNQAYPFTPELNNQPITPSYLYSTPGNEKWNNVTSNYNPQQTGSSFNFPTSYKPSGKYDPNEIAIWDGAFNSQNKPDNTTIINESQLGNNSSNQPAVKGIGIESMSPIETNTEQKIQSMAQEQAKENGLIEEQSQEYKDFVKYNILNPYGGVDPMSGLTYGLYNLGAGEGSKAALGLSRFGIGALREGLSAYGAGKSDRQTMENYRDRQFNTPPKYEYMEEGGKTVGDMMTGNYIMDNGVVETNNEEDLIYFNKLKGKKIISYTFNRGTNKYDIEYE